MRSDPDTSNLFPDYLSALDPQVSLAQELNLSDGALSEAADSAGFRAAQPRAREEPEPIEALAVAVIRQTAEDWRKAVRTLRRTPDNERAARRRKEAEQFFRSAWFQLLTDLDGSALLDRLKRSEGMDIPDPAPSGTGGSSASRRLRDLRRSLLLKRFT